MTPTVSEIDKRLAAIDVEITAKTTARRDGALRALIDKSAASARAKLKEEIARLTVERDDLQAARDQAMQIDADEVSAAEAEHYHAQRLADYRRKVEAYARARAAADRLGNAATDLIAAARALNAEAGHVDATAHEHLSFLPRRVVKGIVEALVATDIPMNNFEVRDTSDHWTVGLGAVELFKRAAALPEAI